MLTKTFLRLKRVSYKGHMKGFQCLPKSAYGSLSESTPYWLNKST